MNKIIVWLLFNCIMMSDISGQAKVCKDTIAFFQYFDDSNKSGNLLIKKYPKYRFVKDKIDSELRDIYIADLRPYSPIGLKMYVMQDSLHYFLGEKYVFILDNSLHLLHSIEIATFHPLAKGQVQNDIYDMFVLDGRIYLESEEFIFALSSDLRQVRKVSIEMLASLFPGMRRQSIAKIAVKGEGIDYFYPHSGISDIRGSGDDTIKIPIIILDTGLNVKFFCEKSIRTGYWLDNLAAPKKKFITDSFGLMANSLLITWFLNNDSLCMWFHVRNIHFEDKMKDSFLNGYMAKYVIYTDKNLVTPITWELMVPLSDTQLLSFMDLERKKMMRKKRMGFHYDIFKSNLYKMNVIRNGRMTLFNVYEYENKQSSNKGVKRYLYYQKSNIIKYKLADCIDNSYCVFVNDNLKYSCGNCQSFVRDFYSFMTYSAYHQSKIVKLISSYQTGIEQSLNLKQQLSNKGISYIYNSTANVMMLIDSNGYTPYNDFDVKLWQAEDQNFQFSMLINSKGLAFNVPMFFYDKKDHSSQKYKNLEKKFSLDHQDLLMRGTRLIGGWNYSSEIYGNNWHRVDVNQYVKDSVYQFIIMPGTYTLVVDGVLRFPDKSLVDPVVILSYDYDTGDSYGRKTFNNEYYQMDIKKVYKIKVRKNGKIRIRQIQ